jgi:hypothetical protein
MLNETGFGAGGDSSGRTIGDVVLVGRSWFRMTSGDEEGTPVPLSPTKTARIGIDRRRLGLERRTSDRRTSIAPIALPPPTEAQPVEWDANAELPARTVTVSWWLLGIVGAVLMASGAAAAAMLKLRAAPAPVVSAVPVPPAAFSPSPERPPAPVLVEPLAPQPLASPPPPPSQVAPAGTPAPATRPVPAARTARPAATATAPARRAPLAPPKRSAATAASTPTTPRSKVWVDPFAE